MIMSVDQGFANYGYSLWDKNKLVKIGIIQTKPNKSKKIRVSQDMIRRHGVLSSELSKIIHKYKVHTLIGEMPGFGAKSSSAAVAMTMASAITLTLCNVYNLKTLWHTPREIKEYFTGDPNASKVDMMIAVCKRHNWPISYKRVKDRNFAGGFRKVPTYRVLGKTFPMCKFEHIADSIAAYHTTKYYYEKNHEKKSN